MPPRLPACSEAPGDQPLCTLGPLQGSLDTYPPTAWSASSYSFSRAPTPRPGQVLLPHGSVTVPQDCQLCEGRDTVFTSLSTLTLLGVIRGV